MISKVPLRLKFLALLLVGVFTVTIATLLVVRSTVDHQVRMEIVGDLRNSVRTFKTFQQEREITQSHYAELLADLPNIKALMTTKDVATIQDASEDTWSHSGSDLLVLADSNGNVMAVHAASRDVSSAMAQKELARSFPAEAGTQWWYLGGHLYEIFLNPINSGRPPDNHFLGVLAVGYEINQQVVKDVSSIATSEVTFLYGNSVVASTITPANEPEFARKLREVSGPEGLESKGLQLGNERYLATSVELTQGATPSVCLSVLKSYDKATARFHGLYQTLVALGIIALFGESLLAFAVFRRFTRPLEKLVEGVRALGKGDFTYPLDAHGRDELAEVTASFIHMRDSLQETQRQLLDSERLATIGRMASSISHDMRHQLTAIMANSEFLCERNLDAEQSEEFYQEIRSAVGQMADLIDSLLEFSRTRGSLSLSYASIEETLQRAIRLVQSHPVAHKVNITLSCEGSSDGWFDLKKLERMFYNLLLNACQAVPPNYGAVETRLQEIPGGVEITISDNGGGIPERIRDKIFEPFVSYGKENGTGLGLTIVQKILEDHGGTITLADPEPGKTTFLIRIPFSLSSEPDAAEPAAAVGSNKISSMK
ncbi:MAG TPA: HAMP domain-containing sensor histidine kinase [Candidatus Solibacter sp.]|jgi:signal transduction histidine kinase|nr:HAMP domain-containing sensor histidine kinase [Candidatus Solibacter sp.]